MQNYCHICWILLPSDSHRQSHFSCEKHKTNVAFKKLLIDSADTYALSCDICCVTANTRSQLEAHMASKSHYKKISDRNFILDKFVIKTLNKVDSSSTESLKESTSSSLVYSSSESIESNPDEFKEEEEVTTPPQPVLKKSSPASPATPPSKLKNDDSISNWCVICYVRYTSPQNREQHVNGQAHKKREEVTLKEKELINCKNYCKLCYTMTNDITQLERHLKSENHQKAEKQYVVFYNLITKNPDFQEKFNIPYVVNTEGKLIDATKVDDSPAAIGSKRNSTCNNNNNEILDIEPIEYNYVNNITNLASENQEDDDTKWNSILDSFAKIRAILLVK